MRASFTEEILEGANQIQVTEKFLRQMLVEYREIDDGFENFTLAMQHYYEIELWIRQNQKNPPGVKQASEILNQIKIDCYLGERILLCQPMNVHIVSTKSVDKSMRDFYYVLTVMLTNHGIYIFDDKD